MQAQLHSLFLGERPEELPAPFIVGAPRSGTTLLRLMLDRHSELAIPHETHFLFEVAARSEPNEITADFFCELLRAHFTWRDFHLDAEEFRSAVVRLDPFTPAAALRTFYRMYAARFRKSRWGEKTPDYGSIMPAISRLLPEAHFIHLVRDGRDVAVSKRDLWFGPGPDIAAQARDWHQHVANTRQLGTECPHFLEVRFEDLVSEPEATLCRICAFLQIVFEPAMLHYHKSAESRLDEVNGWPEHGVTKGQFRELHRHTSESPRRDRIGRWRSELNRSEIAVFNAIAHDVMHLYGYVPERPRPLHKFVRKPAVSCVLLTDRLTPESCHWFGIAKSLFDELVIVVDVARADAETRMAARRLATRYCEVEGRGYVEAHLAEMIAECDGDWILRLDSDEELDGEWRDTRWRDLLASDEFTHFQFPRRWIHPAGGFINCAPWWPDPQLRLFRNNPAAFTLPRSIHEPMSVAGDAGNLRHLPINHHVLRLLSRAAREEKVSRYRQLRPELPLAEFYLYEELAPPSAPVTNAKFCEPRPPRFTMERLGFDECKFVRLQATDLPRYVQTAQAFWPAVTIGNDGDVELSSAAPFPVHLSYHWRDQSTRRVVEFDGYRTQLHPPVGCGEAQTVRVFVRAPSIPGEYSLELTVVQEAVRWFEDANPHIPIEQHVSVAERPARPQ